MPNAFSLNVNFKILALNICAKLIKMSLSLKRGYFAVNFLLSIFNPILKGGV